MKHTQDKWVVCENLGVTQWDYRQLYVVSGEKQICKVLNTVDDEERYANANLIASAPAMLEALQLAATFIDEPVQMIDGEWCTMSKTEVMKTILDAIAMAKGVDNDTI